MMTMDLSTGEVPSERLREAYELIFAKNRDMGIARSGLDAATWKERGPFNVAGRTRAILIDKRDPTSNTLWTGGVSGGIWKCTNIDAPSPIWTNIDDYLPNIMVTDIAQNPSQPEIMFYCTGEQQTDLKGNGVFRSNDGGETWVQLPNTLNGNFDFCQKIMVIDNGHVFCATQDGVFRSTDNGDNWTRVLGSAGVSATDLDFGGGYIYAVSGGDIFSSQTGASASWSNISNSVNLGFRTLISVSPSDPNTIYAVSAPTGVNALVFKTTNRGQNWQTMTEPRNGQGANFASQAWYCLDIAVHPTNPNLVITGGLDNYVSENGGASWRQFSLWIENSSFLPYIHADQHAIIFDRNRPGVCYIGNDGGVYQSSNASSSNPTFRNRNYGLNITQFYACAMHPGFLSNYFLAGAQDNGTQQFTQPGLGSTNEVRGGDGFNCFIDENQPSIQINSLYYGDFSLSTDGGRSWSGFIETSGSWTCPSDYDSRSNTLYAQTNAANRIYRVSANNPSITTAELTVTGASIGQNVTCIKISPSTPNKIYLGNNAGRLFVIQDASQGSSVVANGIGSVSGTISSIDIDPANENHLLITCSNYGLANSIYESTNGGQTWVGVEGTAVPNNMPDIPVNWGMFNPRNPSQAIIATELGVWSTELLNGANTVWDAPNINVGTPLTQIAMLRHRASDGMVAAATFGRGLWTSDIFSSPFALAEYNKAGYINGLIPFTGENSLRADNQYNWIFGDGGSSTTANPTHTYLAIGTYPVNLIIGGNADTSVGSVKILPDMPTPQIQSTSAYSGSFEVNANSDFAIINESGSPLVFGRSNYFGKSGIKSGTVACVLDPANEFYRGQTKSYLYTPAYDISDSAYYELSFWGKYNFLPYTDGFTIEYTLDKGQTWRQLGSHRDANWFTNESIDDNAAFPTGSSFFTNSSTGTGFKEYKRDITDFAGHDFIAFRFIIVSKANPGATGYGGLAIDDIEVRKFEDEYVTRVVSFTGRYDLNNTIKLDWTTQPMYKCWGLELEVSDNGRDFTLATPTNTQFQVGLPGTDLNPRDFAYTHPNRGRDIYYYRLKVRNLDGTFFYTPSITVLRNIEAEQVFKVFPSAPLSGNDVQVSFTSPLSGEVTYELFDAAGQKVTSGVYTLDNHVSYSFPVPEDLAKGTYFVVLNIKSSGKKFTERIVR